MRCRYWPTHLVDPATLPFPPPPRPSSKQKFFSVWSSPSSLLSALRVLCVKSVPLFKLFPIPLLLRVNSCVRNPRTQSLPQTTQVDPQPEPLFPASPPISHFLKGSPRDSTRARVIKLNRSPRPVCRGDAGSRTAPLYPHLARTGRVIAATGEAPAGTGGAIAAIGRARVGTVKAHWCKRSIQRV